jgi:hypothetical protein
VAASARSAGAAVLLLAVALIDACGGSAPSGPAPSPRITCVGVPPEKCDEAVASVERSLPDETPEAIDVTCVSGGCTSTSGAMDTVVTLPGGRQLHANPLTWGNGGGQAVPPGLPALPVVPVCLGVPDAMCRQNAGTDFAAAGIHGGVVKIVVSCSKKPCTDKTGEGDTVITFGDGTTQTMGWAYATAE